MVEPVDPPATNTSLQLQADTFLKAAVSLKDKVVGVTWNGGGRCRDPTLYTGLLGTAFTCLRSYEVTGDRKDLLVCADIVDSCAGVVGRTSSRHVTFLCGRGGVYALGAVAANYLGDHQRRSIFLDLFLQVAQEGALPVGPEEGGFGMSYDLLYGRAGFLWASLFLNKYLGQAAVPQNLLLPVVQAILAGGRVGACNNDACPLMYRWHGTRYWGASHGLAGILQVLLYFPLSGDDAEDVKATLRYMVRNRFPQSGNYPSYEGDPRDKLVQWSHGATGIGITLGKASQVFPTDREFWDAAIEAGEVVWKRGLVQNVGLADGVAGNAYAFLSLYRLTGDSIYKDRAGAFASSLYHGLETFMAAAAGEDQTYSLFKGLAGIACLWFDVFMPEKSAYPGYEV